MPVFHPKMEEYLSKHISDICGSEYIDDKTNHCAHFVSHVLGYQFGFTCKNMTGKGKDGVCIRVHELFPRCPSVGLCVVVKLFWPQFCIHFGTSLQLHSERDPYYVDVA